MSNAETPVLAVRGSTGISVNRGPPSYDPVSSFPRVTSKKCRTMIFSSNGQYFAWFDGAKISIVSVATWKIVAEIEKPKTMFISFSPNGTYLNSWETFTVSPEQPKGSPNLFIWRSATGELAQSYVQKKQMNWQPQYSKDEKVCARYLDGQVLFYEKGNFETPVHKISSPKVEGFSVSPGSVYYVLCYMPGDISGPSFGKLFRYPKFEMCVANKTFFKADKVDMYWNNKGVNVLLLTSTETDKTGASYYGKQSLHFLSTKGDTAIVLLNKEGPIYSVSWSPRGDEFCVLYGYMPAKAALFNQKCEIVFDFGSGHRNSIYFNPHGNILLLGGFGNINGHVEIWDATNKRKIKSTTISDTTFLQWSPDGAHFVTATTAPRLRVDNGFKIYHYSGALLYERPWNKQEELWQVMWQAYPENTFKKPAISFKTVEGIQPPDPAAKEVYRPPAARGLPSASAVKFSLHEEAKDAESRPLSKAVLKMKKKRESKRQAKLQQQQQLSEEPAVVSEDSRSNTLVVVDNVPAEQSVLEVTKSQIYILKKERSNGNTVHQSQSTIDHGDIDLCVNNENSNSGKKINCTIANDDKSNAHHFDKITKIKKIKMSLKSIEKLREMRASGKELDRNQLKKIERETELLKELKNLQL